MEEELPPDLTASSAGGDASTSMVNVPQAGTEHSFNAPQTYMLQPQQQGLHPHPYAFVPVNATASAGAAAPGVVAVPAGAPFAGAVATSADNTPSSSGMVPSFAASMYGSAVRFHVRQAPTPPSVPSTSSGSTGAVNTMIATGLVTGSSTVPVKRADGSVTGSAEVEIIEEEEDEKPEEPEKKRKKGEQANEDCPKQAAIRRALAARPGAVVHGKYVEPTYFPTSSWKTKEGVRCACCSGIFDSIKRVEEHLVRNKSNRLCCHICNKMCSSGQAVEKHVVQKHLRALPPFELAEALKIGEGACILCGQDQPCNKENRVEVFTDHFRKKHDAKYKKKSEPADCPLCGKRLADRYYLKKHVEKCGRSRSNSSSSTMSTPEPSATLPTERMGEKGKEETKATAEDGEKEEEEEEEDYNVETILDARVEGGSLTFLVKWQGFPSNQSTWEPMANLNCSEVLRDFYKSEAGKAFMQRGGVRVELPVENEEVAAEDEGGDEAGLDEERSNEQDSKLLAFSARIRGLEQDLRVLKDGKEEVEKEKDQLQRELAESQALLEEQRKESDKKMTALHAEVQQKEEEEKKKNDLITELMRKVEGLEEGARKEKSAGWLPYGAQCGVKVARVLRVEKTTAGRVVFRVVYTDEREELLEKADMVQYTKQDESAKEAFLLFSIENAEKLVTG